MQVDASRWVCDKFMGNRRTFIVSRRGDPGGSPFFACGSSVSVQGESPPRPYRAASVQHKIVIKTFPNKFAYGFIN